MPDVDGNSGNSENESTLTSLVKTLRTKHLMTPEQRALEEERKAEGTRAKIEGEKASGVISKTKGAIGDYIQTRVKSSKRKDEKNQKIKEGLDNIRKLNIKVIFVQPIKISDKKSVRKLPFEVTVFFPKDEIEKGIIEQTSIDELISVINEQFNVEIEILAGEKITDYELKFTKSNKNEIRRLFLESRPIFSNKRITVYAFRNSQSSSAGAGAGGGRKSFKKTKRKNSRKKTKKKTKRKTKKKKKTKRKTKKKNKSKRLKRSPR